MADTHVVEGARRPRACSKDRAGGVPVEFAGWLPVYRSSGNCGQHPQFAHTQAPPPGFRFTRSGRPPTEPDPLAPAATPPGLTTRLWRGLGAAFSLPAAVVRNSLDLGPAASLTALAALVRLAVRVLRGGCRPGAVARFLQTRHFRSQAMLAKGEGLVYLTAVPFTYGQRPWVIALESPTTLFHPFLQAGATLDVDVARSPYLRIVKALLESDRCRGIIAHVRSTARALPVLFGSDLIARKVSYCPRGVSLPDHRQSQEADGDDLELLFAGPWDQDPDGFFLRGGLDVLEAFALLHARYPRLRLTLRSRLPPRLSQHHHRLIERCWVRVIQRPLSDEEMGQLLRQAHVYLLPAARLHATSVLRAMSYGVVPVVSDGWGMREYVTHGRNGLVVPGRYGTASWMDEQAGMLREDYRPMYQSDPRVVEGLVEAVSRLVEEPQLRRTLGHNARSDVATVYSLEAWNQGLKAAFDRARGVPHG
jgi:glycosyltransferase involved in cell wall biosynthesis